MALALHCHCSALHCHYSRVVQPKLPTARHGPRRHGTAAFKFKLTETVDSDSADSESADSESAKSWFYQLFLGPVVRPLVELVPVPL